MIQKDILKEVLLDQEKGIRGLKSENFVLRAELDKIKDLISIRHSIVITGARRSGKTIFLYEIADKFFGRYYYINFEDERLSGFDLKDFNNMYEVLLELFGKSKVFFLDEVQNINGWEKWVRRMYDNGFKFFITGSNARLLSKELATLLTGRHITISITPFSFREFLEFHRFGLKNSCIYDVEKRALIRRHFSDYLLYGGFPEYLKYKKIEILQEYFNDIIQKDVVERYRIKNIKQLKEIARYMIINTGNLMTYNQLRYLAEMKSVNTVINYTSYLENAFLVFRVPLFSYSIKKQLRNPFKIFASDIGLKNAITTSYDKNIGRTYETIVAIELKRRCNEVFYWKNTKHEEVDFVVKDGKFMQLIQVCYNIFDKEARGREIKSIIKASKELRCNNLLVITNDYEAEEKIQNKKIKFVSLWKWLIT